jgi:G3E family GTPase
MAAVTVRKLKLPIPVTIVTGGLGTGKTTVLRHLVANKPPEGGSPRAI